MLDAVTQAIGGATQNLGGVVAHAAQGAAGAASAASNAVHNVADNAMNVLAAKYCQLAGGEVKKHTNMDIVVEFHHVAVDWLPWMVKTGINSICTEQSWAFMKDQHKAQLFHERGIKKIKLTVMNDAPEEDNWIVTWANWDRNEKELIVYFYPGAKVLTSEHSWDEGGNRSWWNLCDDILFALKMTTAEGPCFYKSDYVAMEDVEVPNGQSAKRKRWLQFRHWILVFFANERPGWNWGPTKCPPPLADGSPFTLQAVSQIGGTPGYPSIPHPQLPQLNDVELPPAGQGAQGRPPSLAPIPNQGQGQQQQPQGQQGQAQGQPQQQQQQPAGLTRPKGKWACHGYIELTPSLLVKAKDNVLVLSDATVTYLWQDGQGKIQQEKKENVRLELDTPSALQADSWFKSLQASGVKEGEVGGCCTIM